MFSIPPVQYPTSSEKLLPRRKGWLGGTRHHVPPQGTQGRGKKRKWEQDSGKETAPANHKVVLRFCAAVKCLTSEKTRMQILLPHKADSTENNIPSISRAGAAHTAEFSFYPREGRAALTRCTNDTSTFLHNIKTVTSVPNTLTQFQTALVRENKVCLST